LLENKKQFKRSEKMKAFTKDEINLIYDTMWRCLHAFDAESKVIATGIINKIEKKDAK